MHLHPYRIHYILKYYMDRIKYSDTEINRNDIFLRDFHDDAILSSDGKKHQLIDQIIFKAIAHFSTGVWEEKGRRVAEDLLHDLSDEDGRKLHETLIQDSRRR